MIKTISESMIYTVPIRVSVEMLLENTFFEVRRLPTIVKNPSTCVLAYLLPDRSRISKRKASGSRSGEFRSQIKYHVSQSELTTRCLLISLWKNSFLTKRRCIGEVSNLNKFYLKQDS